jgi:hypothetical protein
MIVRNEAASVSAWDTAAQWGISTQPGGTPAATNGSEVAWQFEGSRQTYFTPAQLANPLVSGPAAGTSGVSNQLRYALGLTPFESTAAVLTGSINEDSLNVHYRRRKNLLDEEVAVESTADFNTWTALTAPAPVFIGNNDGTETASITGPAPFPAGSRRFLHLRVALQTTP